MVKIIGTHQDIEELKAVLIDKKIITEKELTEKKSKLLKEKIRQ